MRKLLPFVLLISLFGCSFSRTAKTDEDGIRLRYQECSQLQLKAEISAEFPGYVTTYLVDYLHSKDAEDRLTVLEPESISGITVTLDGETPLLSVGETRLELGTLDKNGLSPISVLPRLLDFWKETATETETVKENGEDCLLTVYEEENCRYRTLFSRETYLPIRAEVFCEGECVLRVRFVT